MDSQEIVQRFRRERQILAQLQHDNIARVLDGGLTGDGQPYFTMEYVEGEPIDAYCDRHRLTIEARLRLFLQVCDAVHAAHRNLVVHRDLKPGNILVTPDGTAKLLDFGIARVLSHDGAVPATVQTGGLQVMTPEYASPEQVRGEPVTTASDVYGLGVVLYELLAGRRPYDFPERTPAQVEKVVTGTEPKKPSAAVHHPPKAATSGGDTLAAVSHARRSQPRRLQRLLAGDLDNICLMALRKEPERRYGSAAQLRDDIHRYLNSLPVAARPATLRYRVGKFMRRHTAAVAAATAGLILLAGLTGYYTTRLAAERDRAQAEAQKAQQVAGFLAGLFKTSDPSEARGRRITARELLDRGAARIERELATQPEVQANMMEVVGTVYQSLAQLDEAAELLEKSLSVREHFAGEVGPEIARTLWVLGKVRSQQGNYEAADSLQR
ncbi:MAG: serine/threonine-protein kinase, partial [candidate division KSB1 bacterium]|nr:serine/threonine-protein kinase [candidate division KSB1 bacterium]